MDARPAARPAAVPAGPTPADAGHAGDRAGLPFALGAYVIWGLAPIYFKLLQSVPAFEVIAQRILWSVPLCLAIVLARRQWGEFASAFRSPRVLATLAFTAGLIATNWLIFIHAIFDEHLLAASLGYYLNPLVNVLLARLFLGERLDRYGIAAVALAATGVALLLVDALSTLWISLSLAFSFAVYGLVRKTAPVGALPGLSVETCLLFPACLAFSIWTFTAVPASPVWREPGITALLALAGVVTTTPLLLFAVAARRMRYATLGFVQYIAPTISFLLGLFVYREPLKPTQLVCFLFIWAGIAVFSAGLWRRARAGS